MGAQRAVGVQVDGRGHMQGGDGASGGAARQWLALYDGPAVRHENGEGVVSSAARDDEVERDGRHRQLGGAGAPRAPRPARAVVLDRSHWSAWIHDDHVLVGGHSALRRRGDVSWDVHRPQADRGVPDRGARKGPHEGIPDARQNRRRRAWGRRPWFRAALRTAGWGGGARGGGGRGGGPGRGRGRWWRAAGRPGG